MFKDQMYSNALVQEGAVTSRTLEEDTRNAALEQDEELDSTTQEQNDPSEGKQEDDVWKKRYSDFRSHAAKKEAAEKAALAEKEKTYQEQIKKLQEQLKSNSAKSNASDDVVARYFEDYPEAMQVMTTLAKKEALEETKRLEAELEWFKEQAKKESAAKTYDRIVKAHPDATILRDDEEFIKWFERQRPKIKDMIQADDPEDVIEALDKFKKDTGRTKEAVKQDQLEASKAVISRTNTATPSKGKRIWTNAEIEKMPEHLYTKHYQEIQEALAEGRIQ